MRRTLLLTAVSATMLFGIASSHAQDQHDQDNHKEMRKASEGKERRNADRAPGEEKKDKKGSADNDRPAKRDDASRERREDRENHGAKHADDRGQDAKEKRLEQRGDRSPDDRRMDQKGATPREERREDKLKRVGDEKGRHGNPMHPDADNVVVKERFAKRPELDVARRTRIQETIRVQHAENIPNADFNVRVGRMVPSHYRFSPLPEDIISIVPQYRGYTYVVADDEIIITEPQTHRIVYTLPVSGSEGERSNCR